MMACTATKRASNGFTLLEMVTVIVLLGVISVGITGFIRIGTSAYVDVTNRDELIANGRFVVERLNRELRAALPNSVRNGPNNNRNCIEFIPVESSTVYIDIPVSPEIATNIIPIIRFSGNYNNNLRAAVYPINADDLYGSSSDRVYNINSFSDVTGNEWEVTLSNSPATHFAEDSPTKRIYFVNNPVSFCKIDTSANQPAKLYRYQGYTGYDQNNLPDINGVLMADYLVAGYDVFEVSQATHLRNAIVHTDLRFTRNGETMTFSNDIQVLNVP